MKALLHERYGSPDDLRLAEVDRPTAGEGQVLVRVHAASVNAGDWRRVRAKPFIVRTAEGWRRPGIPCSGPMRPAWSRRSARM